MKLKLNHEQLGAVELRTRRNYGKVRVSVEEDLIVILLDVRLIDKFYPIIDKKYIDEILKLKSKLALEPQHQSEPQLQSQTRPQKHSIALGDKIECCNFQIIIEQTNLKFVDTYSAKKTDDCWHLLLPFTCNIDEPQVQQIIKSLIKRILTNEAKFQLPAQVKQLSEKYSLQYSSVKINSAKQRWGSCSSKKAINLSCFLMLLTSDLIDYIIVHELCHTVEMNHSVRFKKLWYSYFPNYQELEDKLSKMSKEIRYYKAE